MESHRYTRHTAIHIGVAYSNNTHSHLFFHPDFNCRLWNYTISVPIDVEGSANNRLQSSILLGVADYEPEFGFNRRLGITPYPEETECKSIKTLNVLYQYSLIRFRRDKFCFPESVDIRLYSQFVMQKQIIIYQVSPE